MWSRFYFPLFIIALAGAAFSVGAIYGLRVIEPSSPPVKAKADVQFTSEPRRVDKSAQRDTTANPAPSPIYPTSPAAPQPAADPAPSADAHVPAQPTAPADDHAQPNNAAPTVTASEPPKDEAAQVQAEQHAQPEGREPVPTASDDKTTGAAPRADMATVPAAKPAERADAASLPSRCDVKACAGAYASFRESDCSYQPFTGPRRLCDNPPASRPAVAAKPVERGAVVVRERARAADVDEDDNDLRGAPDDQDEVLDSAAPRTERRRIIILEPGQDVH